MSLKVFSNSSSVSLGKPTITSAPIQTFSIFFFNSLNSIYVHTCVVSSLHRFKNIIRPRLKWYVKMRNKFL